VWASAWSGFHRVAPGRRMRLHTAPLRVVG
jgi:hypothetical protein